MHRAIGRHITPVNLIRLLPSIDNDYACTRMHEFQYRPERDIGRQHRFEDRHDLVFGLFQRIGLGCVCLAACHTGIIQISLTGDHNTPAARPKSLWTRHYFL